MVSLEDQFFDIGVLAFIYLAAFTGAYLYCSLYLFRNYEVAQQSVQVIFSLTFAVSINLVMLAVFEIGDTLHRDVRRLTWQINLHALTILVLTVTPTWLFYILIKQLSRVSARVAFVLAILCEISYVSAFWLLGRFFPLTRHSRTDETGIFNMEEWLGRIGVAGVTTSAILSGFGLVSTPYSQVAWFRKHVSDDDIGHAEYELMQTLSKISRRKQKLLQTSRSSRGRVGEQHDRSTAGGGGLFATLKGWVVGFTASAERRERDRLLSELSSMETLAKAQVQALLDLRNAQVEAAKAESLEGRFFNMLGYLSSVINVVIVCNMIISILLSRDKTKDTITNAFEWLLRLVPAVNAEVYVQPVSLLYVAYLVFKSVREFLIRCMKLFRAVSSTVNSSTVVLLLSLIMGMYFVSFVLIHRMSMPAMYRRAITAALGNIEFNFFHRWSDVISVISAVTTVGVIAVQAQSEAATLAVGVSHTTPSWRPPPSGSGALFV